MLISTRSYFSVWRTSHFVPVLQFTLNEASLIPMVNRWTNHLDTNFTNRQQQSTKGRQNWRVASEWTHLLPFSSREPTLCRNMRMSSEKRTIWIIVKDGEGMPDSFSRNKFDIVIPDISLPYCASLSCNFSVISTSYSTWYKWFDRCSRLNGVVWSVKRSPKATVYCLLIFQQSCLI